MLRWVWQWNYYRFFKSGLLVDFFFKRVCFFFLKKLYLYYCIFFSEKFFIEEIFLKIKYLLLYLVNISNQVNTTVGVIGFFFINIVYILLFI